MESRCGSDDWFSEELQRQAKTCSQIQGWTSLGGNLGHEVMTKAGKKVTMLKATIERRHKDRDGQRKSSNSFGRNEIP